MICFDGKLVIPSIFREGFKKNPANYPLKWISKGDRGPRKWIKKFLNAYIIHFKKWISPW